MYRILLFAVVLVGGSMLSPGVAAQPAQSTVAFVQAVEMRVRVAHAPIYASPRRNATVVNTLAWNERILALAQVGSFYKVVQPEGGPQGYILNTQLRSAVNPLRASEMPEDLRRRRNYIGARFDLQGGVAVPYRSAAFAEGFLAGANLGARLSYPLMGALGLTARISYQQFGHNDGTASTLPFHYVNARGRDLSFLAGAIGIDLTAFRGHWLAFVATVDGGAYHVMMEETVPSQQNPFGTTSSSAWGGSASVRLSVRLRHSVRLFVEPSYEFIRAERGAVHFVPARIGISLER